MIRLGLVLLAAMALSLLAVAATGEPGVLTAEWLGWRLDTSAAAGAILIGLIALVAVGFWRLVIWVGEAPRRAALARAEARRREAYAALGRGYLALATGDGEEARRLARRAAETADEAPVLSGLLNAQTAEAAGDIEAARSAYEALLPYPDAQGAARRGLARLAWDAGSRDTALEQARAGDAAGRGGAWAWRMLFNDRLEAADWDGALALLTGAKARRALTPAGLDRARAAVLTARAALSETPSAKDGLKAAALSPDFAPAAVTAAALETRAGRQGRAEVVLLRAWAARPHPAIALAYRDARTSETPAERADRLARLIARNPDDRESRILAVERALLLGDAVRIEAAVQALGAEPPTARLLDLKARAAWVLGRVAEARTLAAEAASAAAEPGWSEIDPSGRAFAYGPSDWRRVITAWTDGEGLIHPRHERRDPVLVEARLEPERKTEASVFEPQAEAPLAWRAPDDPGEWDDDAPPLAAPAAPASSSARRPRRKPPKR